VCACGYRRQDNHSFSAVIIERLIQNLNAINPPCCLKTAIARTLCHLPQFASFKSPRLHRSLPHSSFFCRRVFVWPSYPFLLLQNDPPNSSSRLSWIFPFLVLFPYPPNLSPASLFAFFFFFVGFLKLLFSCTLITGLFFPRMRPAVFCQKPLGISPFRSDFPFFFFLSVPQKFRSLKTRLDHEPSSIAGFEPSPLARWINEHSFPIIFSASSLEFRTLAVIC